MEPLFLAEEVFEEVVLLSANKSTDGLAPSVSTFKPVDTDADPSRTTSGIRSDMAGAADTSCVAITDVIAKVETNFISTYMENLFFQGYDVE